MSIEIHINLLTSQKPRKKTINGIRSELLEVVNIYMNIVNYLNRIKNGVHVLNGVKQLDRVIMLVEHGCVRLIACKQHPYGRNWIRIVVTGNGFDIIYMKGRNIVRIAGNEKFIDGVFTIDKPSDYSELLNFINFVMSFIESSLMTLLIV